MSGATQIELIEFRPRRKEGDRNAMAGVDVE